MSRKLNVSFQLSKLILFLIHAATLKLLNESYYVLLEVTQVAL